ncbi:MAG TPA: aminopeptidase N [Trebonia sp.]|nr:aminopeptidase N [Trebonia sp.]
MPIAEITRDETRERAGLLRVDSYHVELDLTGGPETFRSASVVRFDCFRPGAASYADLIAETVHEITLNGSAVDPATAYADGRIALTGLAEHNELRVVADCSYAEAAGLQRTEDLTDGRVYVYTHFEPADARRVFANFEQPDLKAEFTFHVTVPERWIVFSNQPAPAPEAVAGRPGSAIWRFPSTPRISTYLTVLAAGEFHVVRETHTTASGQVIPLGLACRQSMLAFLEPDDVFTITRQGFDYYTDLFGMPYPFAKYDQVFVPDSGGAMENVGCVTITESLMFRSKVTEAMHEIRAMVILHEMAHMWFGDLVTMTWWDDLWLNESFAELCGFQSVAEATRFTGSWTTFCGGLKAAAYHADQQPSTHPIAADVPTLSLAQANFDNISYAKGASVLKALVSYLGRDAFFSGIRAYLGAHGWGNATLADLLGALEASSGRGLTEWSKAWLETAGPNTMRPEFTVGAEGAFTSFAVLQEAPPQHPTLRPHHIAIGLYEPGTDGALVRTHQVQADLTGARTEVPGLIGQQRPDLILLNDDDLDYAIIRFDERSLATLTKSIGRFRDGLARTICWTAVLDMTSQAELPMPAFAAILASGMGAESSVSVLRELHSHAEQSLDLAADPAQVGDLKRQLAAEAITLLRAAAPGSDHQLAWAQMLGWTATAPDQLDLLAGLLDGGEAIEGLAIDTELRWKLLQRLAATGRAGDAQIDAELARDHTNAGQRHAAACRAAVPDAGHKAAAWRALTDSSGLGIEESIAVGFAFNQTEHADLLGDFTEQYFAQLPGIWARHDGILRVALGKLLFPYPAASPELIARVDTFLATPDLDPALARVVIEGRDIIDKALRARALPGQPQAPSSPVSGR